MQRTITEQEYGALHVAYDFLNVELFVSTLPQVLITLQRRPRTMGYFAAERFKGRGDAADAVAHELAMNPDVFAEQTDEEICQTLAHEMAHVWQQAYGQPSRRGYHNRQWAEKMKEIGLHPSTTGKPGGRETGQSVSDYIVPGGPYQVAFAKLAATGFRLNWQSPSPSVEGTKAAAERTQKAASKTKYTCALCGANAWAKPGTSLLCGVCHAASDGAVLLRMAAA